MSAPEETVIRSLPGWSIAICALFLASGCGDGTGDNGGSSTYFHYYMSQPELYEIAAANGLNVNEKSGKKGLLTALGDAHGFFIGVR